MRKERNFTEFAAGSYLALVEYHAPNHPFSFTGPTRYFDRICFWTDPDDSECPTSVFIEGWINAPGGFQQLVDVIEIEKPKHNPFEIDGVGPCEAKQWAALRPTPAGKCADCGRELPSCSSVLRTG